MPRQERRKKGRATAIDKRDVKSYLSEIFRVQGGKEVLGSEFQVVECMHYVAPEILPLNDRNVDH
jgi:hypothetical protein